MIRPAANSLYPSGFRRVQTLLTGAALIPFLLSVLLGLSSCTSDDTENETDQSLLLALVDYYTVTSAYYNGTVEVSSCEQPVDRIHCTLIQTSETEILAVLPQNSSIKVLGSGSNVTVELDLTVAHLDGTRQRFVSNLSGRTELTGLDTTRFTVNPTANLVSSENGSYLMTIRQFDLDLFSDTMNGVLKVTLHRTDNSDTAQVNYSAYYTEQL